MTTDLGINPPLALSHRRWRRWTRLVLGYAAAQLLPHRTAALRNGTANEPLSPADRLIVSALVHRSLKRGEPLDQFAYLHRQMWSDNAVTTYHAAVEDRFARWFLPHQSKVVDALEADLAKYPAGTFHTLVEIGTGSGLMLDYVSKRLRRFGLSSFVGIDLSATQVEQNRLRFPEYSFAAADANKWIPQQKSLSGCIFFCCGGVLEYFPRAVLDALVRHTTTHCAPVRWVVVEPLADHHAVATDDQSLVFGFESTWSHPYATLFRQAGLNIQFEHDLRFEGMRWQLAIAGT